MTQTPNLPQKDTFPSIRLLGVKVSRVDRETTLRAMREFAASGQPHLIVTLDATGVMIARQDEDFRNIVSSAALVTPDGAGIVKGAALLGTPLIERVSGVDMSAELCRIAAEDGFGVYFLGAAPGVAEKAAANLKKRYPALQVAGVHDGYFSRDEEPAVAAEIRASGAKGLLVAMGMPRQEKFVRDHFDELGIGVAMGVGGTLDVFSGTVKRAPVWMQKHGLEWLYRLASNPRKINKVATLPKFGALVLREKLSRRGRGCQENMHE